MKPSLIGMGRNIQLEVERKVLLGAAVPLIQVKSVFSVASVHIGM